MSSEITESTTCGDLVFEEFVSSYSSDELVLDVFYNGCFLYYPLKYGEEILELRLPKVKSLSCSQMCDLLLDKNLCIDESDEEVNSKLRSHENTKKDVDSMSLKEMIAWEQKETQSPFHEVVHSPTHHEEKAFSNLLRDQADDVRRQLTMMNIMKRETEAMEDRVGVFDSLDCLRYTIRRENDKLVSFTQLLEEVKEGIREKETHVDIMDLAN
ncbi:hypothetical protein Tco_0623971 [Tanacetum coccineum]|uniref:Uncharacterized protein n=1 Tax=Tanacetum coccineum TaxID=301880 RepID=A0ABQ4WCQ6_9ASTR